MSRGQARGPPSGISRLAVASGFHSFVRDCLSFFQGFFDGLLSSVGRGELLANLSCDTGELGDRCELNANVGGGVHGRVVRISR